jgi:hypothetical protein
MDTLVKKTVCDWSFVGQELTRLQDDIMEHMKYDGTQCVHCGWRNGKHACVHFLFS